MTHCQPEQRQWGALMKMQDGTALLSQPSRNDDVRVGRGRETEGQEGCGREGVAGEV